MSVERIRARLDAGGSRRPALFRWLLTNHDDMKPIIAAQGRGVDWTAIAEELAALGIKGGRGKVPTSQMVRQTWWKVTRAARRGPAPSQKREIEPVGVFMAAAPAPVQAPPPTANDSVSRLRAKWDAEKQKMPKPMGGE